MFPEGSCACAADLAGAADLGVRYSHQVIDLPEAPAQTTQDDRHQVRCACGRVHVADALPRAGAPGTVTYGPNFQAWCVFLMVMHHVPVERCADILESMSGTRPSDGWVHTLHQVQRSCRIRHICPVSGLHTSADPTGDTEFPDLEPCCGLAPTRSRRPYRILNASAPAAPRSV